MYIGASMYDNEKHANLCMYQAQVHTTQNTPFYHSFHRTTHIPLHEHEGARHIKRSLAQRTRCALTTCLVSVWGGRVVVLNACLLFVNTSRESRVATWNAPGDCQTCAFARHIAYNNMFGYDYVLYGSLSLTMLLLDFAGSTIPIRTHLVSRACVLRVCVCLWRGTDLAACFCRICVPVCAAPARLVTTDSSQHTGAASTDAIAIALCASDGAKCACVSSLAVSVCLYMPTQIAENTFYTHLNIYSYAPINRCAPTSARIAYKW